MEAGLIRLAAYGSRGREGYILPQDENRLYDDFCASTGLDACRSLPLTMVIYLYLVRTRYTNMVGDIDLRPLRIWFAEEYLPSLSTEYILSCYKVRREGILMSELVRVSVETNSIIDRVSLDDKDYTKYLLLLFIRCLQEGKVERLQGIGKMIARRSDNSTIVGTFNDREVTMALLEYGSIRGTEWRRILIDWCTSCNLGDRLVKRRIVSPEEMS